MAWNKPGDAWKQPDDTQGRGDTGDDAFTVNFKGSYEALETAAKALEKGDEIESGWVYASHQLRRVAGNCGVLSIACTPPNPTGEDEGGQPTVEPLKDVWSIKAMRNDVSVMAYCGESASSPNRAMAEAWMKEPDGKLASQYKFRDDNGNIVDIASLAPVTIELLHKLERGVESVVRFYPVITRVRTYADCPPDCLKDLGYLVDPETPPSAAKTPTGLESRIAELAGKWLKMQDDCQEQPDGKWTRTESWWGSPDGWDADLYGDNRWAMPYYQGAPGNGGAANA